MMDRVNRILDHPEFQRLLRETEELERERVFCRHDLPHLLDVARIMALKAGEEGCPLPTDVLYAAALVHDLGRSVQYREGIPHEQAAQYLAGPILAQCGYAPEEQSEILAAVAAHRTPDSGHPLGRLLYWADKKSRLCRTCTAAGACHWPEAQKNHSLEF